MALLQDIDIPNLVVDAVEITLDLGVEIVGNTSEMIERLRNGHLVGDDSASLFQQSGVVDRTNT